MHQHLHQKCTQAHTTYQPHQSWHPELPGRPSQHRPTSPVASMCWRAPQTRHHGGYVDTWMAQRWHSIACRGLPTIRQYSQTKLKRTHVRPRCKGRWRRRRERDEGGEGRNEQERNYVTVRTWSVGLLHEIMAPEVVREEAAVSSVNKRMKDAHAYPRTQTHTHTSIHILTPMHTVGPTL